MPNITIVAGPNGAGKSQFIREHLPSKILVSTVRLDADEIERQVDVTIQGSERRAFVSGRLLLRRMQDTIDARGDLIVETTLTLRNYANKIPGWKQSGYRPSPG